MFRPVIACNTKTKQASNLEKKDNSVEPKFYYT